MVLAAVPLGSTKHEPKVLCCTKLGLIPCTLSSDKNLRGLDREGHKKERDKNDALSQKAGVSQSTLSLVLKEPHNRTLQVAASLQANLLFNAGV